MTPQEYVTAFSFFGFTMLMTGGIALAIFWPSKKTKSKKSDIKNTWRKNKNGLQESRRRY